jgi:uncharacterized protein YbjT (DUF2867 family)
MGQHHVFITGGTGYVGRRLIRELLAAGHQVAALVRAGSETKLPPGAKPKIGNPLDKASFVDQIRPADTLVQLVGVPRPSPAKAKEFRAVDLVSVTASVQAVVEAGIQHFVYVSVAHPAPIMKAYIAARSEGEGLIEASNLNATILRPWYILGPGHRWPYFLLPIYWICERLPKTRPAAERLGLVALAELVRALTWSVDDPAQGIRVMEVPEIRKVAGLNAT